MLYEWLFSQSIFTVSLRLVCNAVHSTRILGAPLALTVLLLLLAVQWAASVLCDPTGSAAAQKSKLCCVRKRNGR